MSVSGFAGPNFSDSQGSSSVTSSNTPSGKKPRKKKMSMMFEISVIYSLILAFTLLVFSGVIFLILSETLYMELDNEVELKAKEIASNIGTYLNVKGTEPTTLAFALENVIGRTDNSLRRWWYIGFERSWFQRLEAQDISRDYINFLSPQGASLIHSPNVDPELLHLFEARGKLHQGKKAFYYLRHKNILLRVIDYPFTNEGQQYTLQVGISMHPVIELLQTWMNYVFLSIPIILLLMNFSGRVLVSSILKPVRRISDTANAISYADLSKRVPKENAYDEMDSLVDAFNNMIERLEKSFSHIPNFSSHMAHELKTPLTIMRGEAELALMVERTPEEYKDALNIIQDEIAKMLKIIDDLLFLTKMNHHQGIYNFEQVNFRDFFQEIYEQAKLLALKKEIHVELDTYSRGPLILNADPLHLRRLFFNLLDNAIKYSPSKSRISIKINLMEGKIIVSIQDEGSGITQEELNKIFERFYSADHNWSGSGLGLSIAQSIAKAHGGQIQAKSQPNQGTIFTVILPAG